MKNLATCKPTEFMKQTCRIRKVAEEWLKGTNILNLRKEVPELKKITNDMDDAEREAAVKENKARIEAKMNENLSKLLDAMLDKYADKTLELLALVCFVEPENVDDHGMDEYLDAISELISNQSVINFFTSLAQLGETLS